MAISDDLPKVEPYPSIRLKGTTAILKLGSEQCVLSIDDLEQLSKIALSRRNEILEKNRRDPERLKAWENQFYEAMRIRDTEIAKKESARTGKSVDQILDKMVLLWQTK